MCCGAAVRHQPGQLLRLDGTEKITQDALDRIGLDHAPRACGGCTATRNVTTMVIIRARLCDYLCVRSGCAASAGHRWTQFPRSPAASGSRLAAPAPAGPPYWPLSLRTDSPVRSSRRPYSLIGPAR
jgi:hypothetical protein